jgi:methylenetetrahydrofolate dehydrogenase (NADP+)/methenyltetrahydrofolate cyclohydrolase
MTDATLIDGKAIATNLRGEVADQVRALKRDHHLTPGLAVILVGENPASQVYTRNKSSQTVEAGMHSFKFDLPAETTQDELLGRIRELNGDDRVHGILVQLPLPGQIEEHAVINAVDPAKDVDGFHVANAGRLATGQDALVPCTPLGCLMLLRDSVGDLSGKRAIVVGRSNIVGKPMAMLLLRENCTVTVAHSRTRDLPGEVRRADIVVAAIGRPKMIQGDWIQPGATVIDVGINRVPADGGKNRLVGDVDFDAAVKVAGAITPVPGGVGPMTIACLLHNTVTACCRQHGIPVPAI